ncbi:MAG: CPBP family intramembrane metalloprotease [Phreatobacter sp.]|nr:CPBP family intramembrane metalloprotease [Phreatobacter sp.]
MGSPVVISGERLPFEPQGRDFPFARGAPDAISTRGWLLVMAGVATGFVALVVPLLFADNALTGWLRVLLFVGLPLLALRIASPSGWTAIFGKVGLREVKLMFAFALLNMVVSLAVGVAVKVFGTVTANAAVAGAGQLGGAQLAGFFAKVGVQLLGEELITILPFLAIVVLCGKLTGIGRNAAVVVAWLVSAVAFGLIHLPTYVWNLVQCVVVIGSARLVLTWAYIWSKNIWVSTGAHIINDWTLIATTAVLAPLATSA